MGRFWCILGGRGRQGSKGMAVKAVGIGPEHHRALAADCQSSLRLEIAWQEEEESLLWNVWTVLLRKPVRS